MMCIVVTYTVARVGVQVCMHVACMPHVLIVPKHPNMNNTCMHVAQVMTTMTVAQEEVVCHQCLQQRHLQNAPLKRFSVTMMQYHLQ